MFTVESTTAEDFEKVYPQLRQCFGNSIPREEWRKIFVSHWESPEEFCGYTLLKDGEVKGYLGLIFSRRVINDRVEKFCNMTSWCVSEDCRGQSLSLLLAALRLKDYTFTNFTASPTVATLLSRLGFTEFVVHQQVMFPVSSLLRRARGAACEFDPEAIRNSLSENERIVFDDHQRLNCEHLLLKSDGGYSYVVLKKTRRKKLPFAKVHYLSHPETFVACAEGLAAKMCLRLRVLGVMVDERYLGGHRLRTSVSYPHQRRAYFKSSSGTLNENQIDTLYSELVVLHN